MADPRWQRIKQVFQNALELQPAERAAFLAQACAGDSGILNEVESLLAAHDKGADFIEVPAAEVVSLKGSAPPASDEVAPRVPDYDLLRVCGEGAFGKVWLVKDRVGAYRAMKIIEFDQLAGLGFSQREVRALGTYCRTVPTHANLVQIFHVGERDNVLYYTMELADDLVSRCPIRDTLPDAYQPMALRGLMESSRLNTDTAVEITLRLLKGLECLHQAGLVHRDIKPANIIFVQREVKLADVSLVAVSQSRMSRVGTPHYMPPDDKMDESADTYALGKVLYEMITARDLSAFPNLPSDERIRSARLDLEKLDAFLARACATRSDDRFATASHMREALLECRFPLHDSPLLELAELEQAPDGDVSASAMTELQQAVRELQEGDTSGTQDSARSRTQATAPPPDAQVVWAVFDRVVRMLPWLVLLILGLTLIAKLA